MLFTPVYGVRERTVPGAAPHMDYWLTDGVYGSFNCILYDDQKPQPIVVQGAGNAGLVPCGTRSRSSRSQVGGAVRQAGGAQRPAGVCAAACCGSASWPCTTTM
jgi:hypothetical protein